MSIDWWSGYIDLPCGATAFHRAFLLPLKVYFTPMCSVLNITKSPPSTIDDFVYFLILVSIVMWSFVTRVVQMIVLKLPVTNTKNNEKYAKRV